MHTALIQRLLPALICATLVGTASQVARADTSEWTSAAQRVQPSGTEKFAIVGQSEENNIIQFLGSFMVADGRGSTNTAAPAGMFLAIAVFCQTSQGTGGAWVSSEFENGIVTLSCPADRPVPSSPMVQVWSSDPATTFTYPPK